MLAIDEHGEEGHIACVRAGAIMRSGVGYDLSSHCNLMRLSSAPVLLPAPAKVILAQVRVIE